MEDDADNNRRSYTPADVRELSDALASWRCAQVRPHPKFTVDGNAETRVLLANEQRALEVCSLSYLAEGLPLPDAVRLVGLGVGAGNCCWLPYLATQRPVTWYTRHVGYGGTTQSLFLRTTTVRY